MDTQGDTTERKEGKQRPPFNLSDQINADSLNADSLNLEEVKKILDDTCFWLQKHVHR